MDNKNNEVDEIMFLEVQKGLQALYSANGVPQFEVNSTTLGILHQILTKLRLNHDSKIEEAKYYKSAAQEYVAKSAHLKESLGSVNISLEDFPESCQKAMRALATSTAVLQLKEPTQNNFLLGLNHLERENFQVSELKRKLTQHQSKLTIKFHLIVKKIDNLRKDVDSLKAKQASQSGEISKQRTQTSFFQTKIAEYEKCAKELEKQLQESGYHPSISHSELVKKNEKIQELEQELREVSNIVDSFSNLPPNETLAKLKINEAEQELLNLEQEIQQIIEQKMH